MSSYSAVLNEDKNNNRSNLSRMNHIEPTRLARLRPEKLNDVAVKEAIALIQQTCGDVDPDIIALVFHECDYNMQQTIARLRARDYEVDGWQTAKPNNKKKNHNNHNIGDPIVNGNSLSENDRPLSQRTSPTSSFRDGDRRNDHYQYSASIRANTGRRGNDSGRHHFIPSNSRYPSRTNPVPQSMPSAKPTLSSEQIPNATSSQPKQSNDERPQIASESIDEYEFVDGVPQSLSFDNSQKTTSLQPASQRRIQSSIPQKPVSMHRTIQFSAEPIDIQFGDVQWNDSVPRALTPSEKTSASTVFNNHEQNISSVINSYNHQHNQEIQDTLSSNYIGHPTTNETDIQFLESTNPLSSSLSIVDHAISNNLSMVPSEGTSHLSDHLTGPSSPMATQSSSQPQVPIPISITRLPPTSTPRALEYTSPTAQFMSTHLQQNNMGATSSAFTPVNNNLANYPPAPREFAQTATWNPHPSNYKANSKAPMIPTGTYQQQTAYQLSPQQQQQQQQIFFGAYPYHTLSPTVVQVFAPFDQWPTTGFSAPMESYPYPSPNYIPTYSNQPQYHLPAKYDQHPYDKEFLASYGQTRSSNKDPLYQQQSSTPSQPTKDSHITSKLSPTAATFSQGAPPALSPSATALYLNPVPFPMPNYLPSVNGSAQQDRIYSYASMENRDNRNGASYGNRNNYYHHGQQQQQQRTHNNNASNSTWHTQQ